MGCSKSSSKKEVNSNTSLPQEIRKTSNKQPNLTHKWATETNKQTNKTNSQRKEWTFWATTLKKKKILMDVLRTSSKPKGF